jgi:hypothetical protein
MKWALVVYFLVNGVWTSAEDLKMDGWYRALYKTDEQCLTRQHKFTENMSKYADRIRAQCEHIGSYP